MHHLAIATKHQSSGKVVPPLLVVGGQLKRGDNGSICRWRSQLVRYIFENSQEDPDIAAKRQMQVTRTGSSRIDSFTVLRSRSEVF